MKCFRVKAANDLDWVTRGGINKEFLVFSEDIVGALSEALSQVDALAEALRANGSPPDVARVRVKEIVESADVLGNVSVDYLQAAGTKDENVDNLWVESVARRAKIDFMRG